jgi:hypothetical protein
MKSILTILLFTAHISSGQITFQRLYAGSFPQDFNVLTRPTYDGGYIISGTALGDSAPGEFTYLIKTNQFGDTLWTSLLQTDTIIGAMYCSDIIQTSDSGFASIGRLFYPSHNILYFKTDAYGNLQWAKSYGNGDEIGYNIQQASNGDFILLGITSNYSAGLSDLYLVRTDSTGNVIWGKGYGGTNWEYPYSLKNTRDGGFILAGSTYSFGTGESDLLLVKTDANGDTLWTRTHGADSIDNPSSIIETYDGYFVSGNTKSFGSRRRVFLVKLDSQGSILWSNIYEPDSVNDHCIVNSTMQTSDSGLIISGSLFNDSLMQGTGMLLKLNQNGNIEWAKKYYPDGYVAYAEQTYDGGYIISGPNYTNISFNIIKTDANGNANCGEQNISMNLNSINLEENNTQTIITNGCIENNVTLNSFKGCRDSIICLTVGINNYSDNINSIELYPNPTSSSLTIESGYRLKQITLFTTAGRTIKTISNIHSSTFNVDLSDLSAGIYFLYCETEKGRDVVKVVKY